MKILLLTHYYEPEIGAPQRRWRSLVSAFIERGHSVAVCAPVPHYPYRSASDLASAPKSIGRWLDGLRGERILRVPYSPTSGSLPGQIVDQAVSSAAMLAVSAAMRRSRPDVIISTTPGLPMPFAASTAAELLGVPHIAEVRDAWPDLIADARLVDKALKSRVPRALSRNLETQVLPAAFHAVLRRADAVVTTTESFSDRLRQRGLRRVETIRNTSEIVDKPRAPRSRDAESALHLLYVGTVGRSQGLEAVVRAVAGVSGVRLRIVGEGAELGRLRSLAAANAGGRVEFYPQTIGRDLEEHWAWAHSGLVSLADVPAHHVTVPSKLITIMARGMHVTGVVAGEAAKLIREAGGGVVADPGNAKELMELLKTLRDDRSSTHTSALSHAWIRSNASPQLSADKYESLLLDIIV